MFGLEHFATEGTEAAFEARTAPQYARSKNGEYRLRMPRAYVVLGALMFPVALAGPFVILGDEKMRSSWPLFTFIALLIGVPSFLVLMYGLNHSITIKDNVFILRGPLKPKRVIGWSEVVTGHYSSLERAIILTTIDGRKHRVGIWLVGAKLFWRALKDKAGLPVGDWGLPYAYWR